MLINIQWWNHSNGLRCFKLGRTTKCLPGVSINISPSWTIQASARIAARRSWKMQVYQVDWGEGSYLWWGRQIGYMNDWDGLSFTRTVGYLLDGFFLHMSYRFYRDMPPGIFHSYPLLSRTLGYKHLQHTRK